MVTKYSTILIGNIMWWVSSNWLASSYQVGSPRKKTFRSMAIFNVRFHFSANLSPSSTFSGMWPLKSNGAALSFRLLEFRIDSTFWIFPCSSVTDVDNSANCFHSDCSLKKKSRDKNSERHIALHLLEFFKNSFHLRQIYLDYHSSC